MPGTATKRRPVAKSTTTNRRRASHTARRDQVVDRTANLSDDVLKSVEAGQLAAIDAVRRFAESVDRTLPRHGDGASRRQDVLDSGLEMADRLVRTQYDFIRRVIDSTAKSLSTRDGETH
ncbi:MAG: hypothetical protein ABSG43_01640 [Solirubrobacteraceae bacterium]|jgi:hypothetical protein